MEMLSAKVIFYVVFCVCYAYNLLICDPGACPQGTYFDKEHRKCLSCPNETFQDDTDHNCTDCKLCSQPEEQEELVRNCTAVSDSKIVCKDGYYRVEDSHHGDGECYKCRKCHFWEIEKCKCGLYHDTVCCVNSEMTDNTCACDTGTKKVTQDRTGEKRDEQYSRISQETMMNYNYKDDQFSTPVKVFLVLIPFIIVFLVHPVISDAILRWCKKLKRS
ncbi:uncharacterized protein LOC106050726 isoform X2 [Biomphalaria glabrata]|uniref:Uncharacterized protein LOC106050726 isoform X2 n=1 Tax=Biomphalaria glabrata TaxID=6526 RepID=A0A9W2Z695_BIOGL|nr:uncharacterized protein LOC106050726 isoform X2 [Biomphalaria glabrata]